MDPGESGGRNARSCFRDEAAIKRELVSMLPRLRRFALSLTGSRDEVDDLVQSALERALANLHQWQPETRLDSWMYRIIQNTRFSQLRAEQARPAETSLEDAEELSAGATTEEAYQQTITLEAVLQAMQKLSEEHRGVLALVCIEGLRYREAAEVLDISVGTVMSRLARARKRLDAHLRAENAHSLGGAVQ